jgi:diaminopimelate epimerase
MEFIKMHGTGNDFVLVDCVSQPELLCRNDAAWRAASEKLCHRRFGVGADQVLLLLPPGNIDSKADSTSGLKADFGMRIFNADGSEVEMCGNGIRCLAKYIWDAGLSAAETLEIQTAAGIIRPGRVGALVMVDMGEPVLDGPRIPVRAEGRVTNYPLKAKDRVFKITCVSMGNPHAVTVIEGKGAGVDGFDVAGYGAVMEVDEFFPKRANIEFIEIINRGEIKMRVWERGSGETLACGTGACAAAVAANIKGRCGRMVTVHLRGGDLQIEWREADGRVYMTGPAVEVFRGVAEV